jgi:plastocyanin
MKVIYATVFGIGAFFALNCGSGDGDPAPQDGAASTTTSPTSSADVVEIKVNGHTFDPPEVHLKAQQTVRWVWVAGRHNVVSGSSCTPDGKFSSELVSPPSKFEKTFDAVGTYPYYCDPHCSMGMTGKIVVE